MWFLWLILVIMSYNKCGYKRSAWSGNSNNILFDKINKKEKLVSTCFIDKMIQEWYENFQLM